MVHGMNPKLEIKNEGDTANYMYMIDERFQLNLVTVDLNSEPPSTWKPHPTPFIDGHMFTNRKTEILSEKDGGLKSLWMAKTWLWNFSFGCVALMWYKFHVLAWGLVPLTEFPEMPVSLTLMETD